jgi:hypothetical protein
MPKRISYLLVLASRQRWPEEICRWLSLATVASPYAFSAATIFSSDE